MRLFTFGRLAVEAAEGLVDGGPRPRRLALLAILAARGERGQTRERVLAILWPETTDARGRHALSQTLYALRQDLNREVVRAPTGDVLALDPAVISSDIEDFRAAVAAGDWPRAAALYAGPFAAGFTLSEAPGFEDWLEDERRRLAREGHRALVAVAEQAEAAGDLERALPHWRRLASAETLNTRHAVGYIRTLSGMGNRHAALLHAQAHSDLIRRELNVDPDPDLRALLNQLRVSPPGPPTPRTTDSIAPARRRFTGAFAARVLGVVLVAGVAWRLMAGRDPSSLPVLAVGVLRDRATEDSAGASGVLRDMLSTNLARVSRLEILAPTRLPNALPKDAGSTGQVLTSAALQAGATEILEGDVSPVPDGLRLDLRRVDLRRGRVRRGYVITAADRWALIDSATVVLTRDLDLVGPASSVADVTTRSALAYRLYEEGLRAFYQADWRTSGRLFRSALAEDTTFALAAIYAWYSAESAGKDNLEPMILRLADRAPDRERMLVRVVLATMHSDPPALPLADSLVRRFPSDPDALIASASARLHRFGFAPEVIAQLERAFALDSMTGAAALRGARVARSLHGQFDAYSVADSSAAAERSLRRWMALQPENSTPLFYLSGLLERQGRVQEAELAYVRNDELAVVKTNLVQAGVWKGINRGDPELLLQACHLGLSGARDIGHFTDYRWRCLLAYRHLGRLREAAALTRPRQLASGQGGRGSVSVGVEGINQLLIAWMTGRPRDAAQGFLEVARNQRAGSIFPGENARRESWWLTLAATAFMAAGDITAAAALEDSIRTVGARSSFGRDPVLHHFVRGLILSASQRHADAMREFQLANYSWTLGYSRVNYEYARSALALGRPRDAIYPLQAALRGGLEGPQLYVTQTELHELLGQVFEAAGMPDSVTPHYEYVARMWAGADREFAERHRRVTDWLHATSRESRVTSRERG